MLKIIGKAAALVLCFCLSPLLYPNKNIPSGKKSFTMAKIKAKIYDAKNDSIIQITTSESGEPIPLVSTKILKKVHA